MSDDRDASAFILRAFRRDISTEAWRDALASFEEDVTEGRYVQADVLWRATLRRAIEISRAQTSVTGCRSLDVLHVATARELGLRFFLTFDQRQARLATIVGLKLVSPRA